MPRTREQHSSDSRRGAYIRLKNADDWTAVTEAARAAGPGSIEYHERKVDPEGKLPPEQRRKQAEAARKLYYLDMAEKSRQARAARKAAREQA